MQGAGVPRVLTRVIGNDKFPLRGRSMKKCPARAELIQSEAVKCKHCGTVLTRNTNSPQIGCVGGGILFILAAAAFNSMFGDSPPPSNSSVSLETAAEPVRTWRSVATVAQAQSAARDL